MASEVFMKKFLYGAKGHCHIITRVVPIHFRTGHLWRYIPNQ